MLEVADIWTPTTQQQIYRALLDAMSHPGRVVPMVCESKARTSTAVLATLLDAEVSLADPDGMLDEGEWPMLQAINSKAEVADYILCSGANPPDFQPKLGTLPSPEMSATLLVLVDSLMLGDMSFHLSGPGVDGTTECFVTGLDSEWLTRRNSWVSAFPLGIDLLLIDDKAVMALPRTAKVEVR